jgi:hypothetical protein
MIWGKAVGAELRVDLTRLDGIEKVKLKQIQRDQR